VSGASKPPREEVGAPGLVPDATAGGALGTPRAPAALIRVVLPAHLRALAGVEGEVKVAVPPPVTQRAVLDALEAAYPVLRGTIRDQVTLKRRPFIRFFACQQDLSHDPPDTVLPEAVATGAEPFLVVGAMAGG
jgi:molybdopterin converting factor small subunit